MMPIIRPCLDGAEEAAVQRVLRSGWITQGPEVAAFEREFADYTGAAHACAVSSCTTALHLALLVAGVEAGDEVITVSHSFIATANAIRYLGAIPVFVDIRPESGCLDPALLAAAWTPRTRAVLCVHQLGIPCDMAAILAFARGRGIRVIEDAACAVGSALLLEGAWRRIGHSGGDLACFSFHPRKLLTTGDGGMITGEDEALLARLRRLRQHGMSVPDTIRHHAQQVIFESYDELGYNYRMTDLQAAIGRVQLAKLPGMVQRRRELAQRYHALLAGIPGLEVYREPEWIHWNYQSFWVRLPEHCDQKRVMGHLLEHGISSRRGVMCAHLEAPYVTEALRWPLPWSERARDRTILLPLYHDMEAGDQERVAERLREACAQG
ncbi:MAG: DegT/DnrJ/EryC1/StrS family aminotransferase [Magnetococcales bacterium]|nr:DegT/DnrJ/EryC1/StrS family aminotransferase [Magnetococcales bacterium]